MRTSNTFAFRPSVEQLTDRALPSVSPFTADIAFVKADTTVLASHATDDVEANWTIKLTVPVQGRKAGGGQKDW